MINKRDQKLLENAYSETGVVLSLGTPIPQQEILKHSEDNSETKIDVLTNIIAQATLLLNDVNSGIDSGPSCEDLSDILAQLSDNPEMFNTGIENI